MYSISAKDVSVSAPTIGEVKELFKFASGPTELQADAEATASRQPALDSGAVTQIIEEAKKEDLKTATVAEPFVGSRSYQDGDSALFGDKVFTRRNGQWVDPNVITVQELAEAENLKPAGEPDPKQVFGAPSTAGAEALPTAPEDTQAVTSIPTPPGVPAPPVVTPENTGAPAVPPTEAPAASVELDKRGLPWDARIHASSKAKLKDGNWKLARNIDPAVVVKVEAELFAARGAAPANQVPPVTVAEPEFVPPVPPAPPADPTDFASLTMQLAALTEQGKITRDQIAAVAVTVGVASLPTLASRPDLVPAFWKEVQALL
jgi:hypothetical protein